MKNTSTFQKSALFFDRDGILIQDKGYPHKKEDLIFVDGIFQSLAQIKKLDLFFFVVTNQSGVARGYFTIEQMNAFHDEMQKELAVKADFKFHNIYFCPHHPEGTVPEYSIECSCRKPKTGLIEQACKDYQVDLKKSYFIGDKDSDMECALRAGMKGILIPSRYDVDPQIAQNQDIVRLNSVSELGDFLITAGKPY